MDRSKIIRIHDCKLSKDRSIIPPVDEFSSLTLENLKRSCEEYEKTAVIALIPQQPDSPLPFHNLYLAFYAGAYGAAMILQYAVTYAITKDEKYGQKAKAWLLASITWDEALFTLYCSVRLMHAIVAGVDWIRELLSDDEIERAWRYLRKLCLHNEKQAMGMFMSRETGGHSNLYAAGFGLAALALRGAGLEPKAEKWLKIIITKYERDLFTHDIDEDGTYQPNGNWCIEYAFRYKFIFLDALRLVTGRDLIKEHFADMTRPIRYLKYAYMGDGKVPVKDFYDSNENMLDRYQIDTFGALFLRFASLTKDPYLQWIGMSNPVPGRMHAYGNQVKGGHRFIYCTGFTDYLWYDPSVRPKFAPPEDKAKMFPNGELAVLRGGYARGLTLAYQGRRGNVMYESPDLVLNLNGKPMLCTTPMEDSLPLAEANGSAAGGGEMERKGVITGLDQLGDRDVLKIDGFLTRQRITVFHAPEEKIEISVDRRGRTAREASIQTEDGERHLRLRGEGYLQYDSRRNFNPNQGALQMEFRLSKKPSKSDAYPAVLFSIGQHLKYMFGDAMFVGFLEDGRLGVKFKDNEGRWLFAHFSREYPAILPDFWHRITVYWKHFNRDGEDPVCGIICGEYHAEARLTLPGKKAFQCVPHTTMWVGAAVQMPDSFASADIRYIRLYGGCPTDRSDFTPKKEDLLFEADYGKGMRAVFSRGKAEEVAERGLEYRLHAQEGNGKKVIQGENSVRLVDGDESVNISGRDVRITLETLPSVHAGFAGSSFEPEENVPLLKRIIIKPAHDESKLRFQIVPGIRSDTAL